VNIAVTGGLGTGKSTIGKILAATLAAEFVDTDRLCRRQMEPGAEGFAEFRRIFGEEFILVDGTLNRSLLRQAVFSDAQLKADLENILHPIVRRQVNEHSREGGGRQKFLVVEVPLLYEVGWQDDFDACVVVYVPEALCVQRVVVRQGLTAEEARQILKAQLPIEQKLDQAHYIVDNSGIFASTVQQVNWLARKLKKERK
jgi:dephospho-CoA kinase